MADRIYLGRLATIQSRVHPEAAWGFDEGSASGLVPFDLLAEAFAHIKAGRCEISDGGRGRILVNVWGEKPGSEYWFWFDRQGGFEIGTPGV